MTRALPANDNATRRSTPTPANDNGGALRLRPYQLQAIEGARAALREHRTVLIVLPTGCGKSVIFGAIAQRAVARGGRVLMVAHRFELLDQLRAKCERAGLRCGIEKGAERVDRAELPDVTIASIQSLHAERLAEFSPDAFAVVLVDEGHHAVAASYRRVIDYFAGAAIIAATATPDRADQAALSEVFEAVGYVYELRDAIDAGYLVPIRQRVVNVESLDLSSVRTVGGDLNAGDVERAIMRDRTLHEIASPLVELAGDRPTIVFVPTVATAHAMAEVLSGYGASAVALDGTTDHAQRAAELERFSRGGAQYLVNCALFTEGADLPSVACVAMARPTKSRALYCQAVGRGTRVLPGVIDTLEGAELGPERRAAIAASSKPDTLVLDFVGVSGRHSLVCALDVLDGRPLDPELRKRAMAVAQDDPQLAIHEALDLAAEQLADEKRRAVMVKARYSTVVLDPFAVLGADDRPGRWGGAAPSDRQLELLRDAGVRADDLARIDRGQASALIDSIVRRRAAGLCTPKQALLLARRGLNPDLPFETAREALSAIAENDWRVPGWMYRDDRYRVTRKKGAAA